MRQASFIPSLLEAKMSVGCLRLVSGTAHRRDSVLPFPDMDGNEQFAVQGGIGSVNGLGGRMPWVDLQCTQPFSTHYGGISFNIDQVVINSDGQTFTLHV